MRKSLYFNASGVDSEPTTAPIDVPSLYSGSRQSGHSEVQKGGFRTPKKPESARDSGNETATETLHGLAISARALLRTCLVAPVRAARAAFAWLRAALSRSHSRDMWIVGGYGWDANPWVWVIGFRKVT